MLNQTWRRGPVMKNNSERSPFAAPPWDRPMRLVVEDEALSDSESLVLLRALATQPEVEIYSTQGSTPYRAQAEEIHPDRDDAWAVRLIRSADEWEAPYVFGLPSLRDQAADVAQALGESVEAIWNRMVIGDLWVQDGYDTIVTEGPLFSEAWRVGIRPTLQHPATALGEVGLCLRAHGNYVTLKEHNKTITMVNAFHRAAAVGMLPAFPDWLSSAFTTWHERQTHEPYVLMRSFVWRVSRALRALDYVRVRALSRNRDETVDELHFFFDSLLVALDGALDCLARFFHAALEIRGSRRQASWDKSEWTDALGQAAPELTPLVGPDGRITQLAIATAKLRNTVHGEVLSSELHDWQESPAVMDYGRGRVFVVAGDDAAAIIEACERLGQETAVEPRRDARVQPAILIEPAAFGCILTREFFAGLNEVLETADRSRLPEPPGRFDMSFELPEPELRRNAALLASIPEGPDRVADALDVEVAQRR